MRDLISSFEAEFRRYHVLGLGVIDQLSDEQIVWRSSERLSQNSIATIVWHIAGNLKSRFTDFLTADGEKPWRDREFEFAARKVSRAELLAKWESGWSVLLDTLAALDDAQLLDRVRIRNQELSVHHALCRSVAHVSYHVGQMVHIGKEMRGDSWEYLSIPPGGSESYNRNPTMERGAESS
ncbi:MAG: DUF1572 family protein [Planctomycetota bacterium]